jgi:transcriptional regulator with XRE-family HTH domain
MSRFEQRLRRRMRDPEFAEGYREMAAELALLQALDEAREQLHISKEELAHRMGRRREAVSRLLNADDANPTLGTITGLLTALGLTAEIKLRRAAEDDAPIEVATAL